MVDVIVEGGENSWTMECSPFIKNYSFFQDSPIIPLQASLEYWPSTEPAAVNQTKPFTCFKFVLDTCLLLPMSFSLLEWSVSSIILHPAFKIQLRIHFSKATPATEILPFSKTAELINSFTVLQLLYFNKIQLFHWFPKETHSMNFHCDFYGFTDTYTVTMKGHITQNMAFHMKKIPHLALLSLKATSHSTVNDPVFDLQAFLNSFFQKPDDQSGLRG